MRHEGTIIGEWGHDRYDDRDFAIALAALVVSLNF
jgi:hypothetical protein